VDDAMTDEAPVEAAPISYYVATETTPAGEPLDPNADSLGPDGWNDGDEVESFAPVVDSAAADGSPTARRHRRWRFVPRSLSGRLVTGVVALVILVVVASGVATYAALGSFLTDRLDQQIDSYVPAYQRPLAQCVVQGSCTFGPTTGGGAGGFAASRTTSRSWFAIIEPNGTQLPITADPDSETIPAILSAGQRSSLIAAAGGHRSTTFGGKSVRVSVRELQTTAGTTYYEVVGLSTDEVTNTLNRLLVIELIFGGSAVLIALLATAFGVRLSLRPLHRVTNTARAVTAELSPEGAGLDRRVGVTDTDTEVGQLAESVNTLLGAVETQFAARLESEQRMRQFMADASHELRTPLTSIRGYAELARMRRALDPNREPGAQDGDADAMDRIESEGTRMSRLVDDLLTLARGDIGAPIEAVPVDIAELMDDAVDGVRAAHPRRFIDVAAQNGLVVYGDHDQLLRAIRNLVTNAAVHTAPNGPIWVTANSTGEHIVIQVRDAGPGLPPEQAAHVFERFWRSDSSRARSSGGSGLGLAIVASIVQAHGGGIRFDSSVAGGSTVTISLPAH
jgi:two-component system OmpR family sensor kinase